MGDRLKSAPLVEALCEFEARESESSTTWQQPAPYRARTALGKRLMELRAKIVASGEPLLDRDGIERDVAERRGEDRRE